MLATFKETLTSIQDKTYGRVIITKPVKQVIWYWLKYVLIFSLIPAILLIGLITYFIPQLPRLVRDNIAPGEIRLLAGKFSTTYPQPISLGSPDFALVVNTHGSAADLDNYAAGVLLLSDKIIIKAPDRQISSQSLSDIKNFSLSQTQLLNWLSLHQFLLLFGAFSAVLVLTLLSGLFYVGYKLFNFLVWSAIFLLIGLALKRRHRYTDIFKITVYAATPSLIISALLFLFPNSLLSLLNFGLFIFFALSWLVNLPDKK